MFFISATERPWEDTVFVIFYGGGGGGGGGQGSGNHLIFRRIEGGIIRNWESKKEIIEEELRN